MSDSNIQRKMLARYGVTQEVYDAALFPLIAQAYNAGSLRRSPVTSSDEAAVTRTELAEAFRAGAEAMADQISEDHFGGNKTFTIQFENPYEEDL